jgi:hypothetical protein
VKAQHSGSTMLGHRGNSSQRLPAILQAPEKGLYVGLQLYGNPLYTVCNPISHMTTRVRHQLIYKQGLKRVMEALTDLRKQSTVRVQKILQDTILSAAPLPNDCSQLVPILTQQNQTTTIRANPSQSNQIQSNQIKSKQIPRDIEAQLV